ncbi:MAG: pyridinium-3,5-biscarboxylic acid mononucleotide sulfurtransferase [Actinomycetota bacterium]|nr:pyridinium-3,5-biscarboxylic acid mononucleotide sulfurtransferase [Actinomycetota bacterium]
MNPVLTRKEHELDALLSDLGNAVIAFSGGVDSALLAAAAHDILGDRALAVTAVSPSLAARERHAAAELAASFGWNHLEIDTAELERPEYVRNEPDRCYWCKTELFEVLEPVARQRGAFMLVGTNADDLLDHRPGLRAARERDVRAPLAEVGLTKEEVRELSGAKGLPTAEKPASPCLASRFAYGVEVTREGLQRIDSAEEVIRALGFDVFRVRDHGDLARIEVPAERIDEVIAAKDQIAVALKGLGFVYVAVDLGGFRSGAMNEVLPPPGFRRA